MAPLRHGLDIKATAFTWSITTDIRADLLSARFSKRAPAAPLQQNRVFVARQWPPDPSHFENAWSMTSSGSCWRGEIERVVNGAGRKTGRVS
jgi:hypothetical protein